MIFKVSFKDTDEKAYRVVQKVGTTTTVVLRGVTKLPAFWKQLPEPILKWIGERKNVELYEDNVNNTLIIYSLGEAKCNKDDSYNSIFGERLAEARAKYHIYKFIYTLTYKLYNYYNRIMFGDSEVIDRGHGSCLARDVEKYEGLCIRESHHIGELLASRDNG